MNQVFYIEELVRRIVLNADDESEGSASLLALACCCKTLEGPVMDVLWQRQKHLHIILRTLPADCWTVTDRAYRVTRTPTTNEWERFKRYAARVVELSIGGLESREVSSETMSFLGMRSTPDPLWPRLTSLRLTNGLSWDAVPSALAFLTPKITNLTFTLPQENSILLQPILSLASNKCRRLQELVLDVPAGDPYPAHEVGGLISACRDTLRTLEIKSLIRTEYLPTIASLQQLRFLKLEKAHFPCDLPPNTLPSLEEVTILRFYGPRLQYFFKSIRTNDLKVVKIYGIDTIAFKKTITAISRFSGSLTVVEISAVENLDLPSVVTPRLLFANLRTLYVGCLRWDVGLRRGPCAFRPTDQAIADLGAVIPNIARLTLGTLSCNTLPCATFLSLVSLSRTCQDLETLEIKVDFQTMITPSLDVNWDTETGANFDVTQGSACKLRSLVVGFSTLPDHPESGWIVAVGLAKIFPSLSDTFGIGLDRNKWEKVGRNIGMLRRVLCTVQQ